MPTVNYLRVVAVRMLQQRELKEMKATGYTTTEVAKEL